MCDADYYYSALKRKQVLLGTELGPFKLSSLMEFLKLLQLHTLVRHALSASSV